ncbi:MAG: amidohydrolase [Alphaproteobacteria bacterium]|nr:amidohydrolase [Alphaproteobacteria bacterium]PHX98472.1 MAG: amidohydrolase [Rhodospirillaceae bacterium]
MTHDIAGEEFFGSCFVCSSAKSQGTTRRTMLRAVAVAPVAAVALSSAASAKTKTAPRPPVGAFVIQAGWALVEKSDKLELVRGAHILVRNGVIEEIANSPIKGKFPVVDAKQHLVVPGFISGHTHVCSATPTRGIIEQGRFYKYPLELVERLSDADQDALTAFNLAELLRSGCTTQIEMSLTLRQAESYVRVADKWGVRGYPGPMIPNTTRLFDVWFRKNDAPLFASEAETLREIELARAFGKKNMNRGEGRIRPMMSAHATDTHTEKTMQAMKAACDDLGTGFHLHLSQSREEATRVKNLWQVSPTEWLEKLGMLDQPVFGAHMTAIDWANEGPILKKHGTVFSHCPSAGGAGGPSMPYPDALGAGVATNIGIDTHSNDYLENLKLAVLIGQVRYWHLRSDKARAVKEPGIWDAIEGATRVPADALKRKDLGRIAVGARADLVSVDVSGFLAGSGALPPEPLNNLLYCNGMMVRHVMTDGRIQIYDGHLAVEDEAKVVAEGGRVVQGIWDQLQKEDWFNKPLARGG